MVDNRHTTLGELFKNRRERGQADLPLMSVTMNDGLVDRESLDRKTDSELTSEGHLLVRAGDIAYNMMRMWQGASGMAQHDAIVSPAYVVLAPTADIDPLFASYWFKSSRMIYLFWAYSYGITGDRLRLYYKDFAKIRVVLPHKDRQIAIGKALASWDHAIELKERQIASKRRLKAAIAKDLLNGSSRFPGFGKPAIPLRVGHATKYGWIPAEWSVVKLGTIGNTYTGLSGKSSGDFGEGSPYIPYLNIFDNARINATRMDYVRVEKDERQNEVRYGDIFFTTSSETAEDVGMASVLLERLPKTFLNSFCFGFRLNDSSTLLAEFAGHMLRGPIIRRCIARLAQGYTRYNLSQSAVLGLHVPVPPLPEQERIASCLSAFDDELGQLRKELSAYRQERKALLQRLMNFSKTEPFCKGTP